MPQKRPRVDTEAIVLTDMEGLQEGLREIACHILGVRKRLDAQEVRIATDPTKR